MLADWAIYSACVNFFFNDSSETNYFWIYRPIFTKFSSNVRYYRSDRFSDHSRDVIVMATNFRGKIGKKTFIRRSCHHGIPLQIGNSQCRDDLATSCKIWSSNSGDLVASSVYLCDCVENTAKIGVGLLRQISQDVLDRSSPNFKPFGTTTGEDDRS